MADETTISEPLNEINGYLLAIAGGLASTLEEIEKSNLSQLDKVKEGIKAISTFLTVNNNNLATVFIEEANVLFPNGRNATLIQTFSVRIEQGAARLLSILDTMDQIFVDDAIETVNRFKSIGKLGGVLGTLLGVVIKDMEGDTTGGQIEGLSGIGSVLAGVVAVPLVGFFVTGTTAALLIGGVITTTAFLLPRFLDNTFVRENLESFSTFCVHTVVDSRFHGNDGLLFMYLPTDSAEDPSFVSLSALFHLESDRNVLRFVCVSVACLNNLGIHEQIGFFRDRTKQMRDQTKADRISHILFSCHGYSSAIRFIKRHEMEAI